MKVERISERVITTYVKMKINSCNFSEPCLYDRKHILLEIVENVTKTYRPRLLHHPFKVGIL